MASSLNNQQAAFYGSFISDVVAMYENHKKNPTPPVPDHLPSNYKFVAWANAQDQWGGTDRNSFYGLVAQAPTGNKEVIVAIRGTENALEWLIDLELWPKTFTIPAAGKVENGFLSVFDTLTFVTTDGPLELPAFLAGQSQVTLIGHSLGSSLVTMLGLSLINQNPALASKLTVYTLASPAIGDSTFASYYDSKVTQNFRIWNEFDLVPRILNWAYTQVDGDGNELVQTQSEFREIKCNPLCEHVLPTYLYLLEPSKYAVWAKCQRTSTDDVDVADALFSQIRAKT